MCVCDTCDMLGMCVNDMFYNLVLYLIAVPLKFNPNSLWGRITGVEV